ncbi:hypothetical protein O6P43_005713 [Quillaja saponaria]|uniref:Uncharacterized protein n=1 Tax=Quillaja saponaria TaxID=32244 RepID=A0AAD7VHC7_QUISA|nr:hypothetical protein O6P43_005713 [Quillaja saponaria]
MMSLGPSPLFHFSCFCRGDLLLPRILGFSLAAHLASVQLPAGLAALVMHSSSSSSSCSSHNSRWLPPSTAEAFLLLFTLCFAYSVSISIQEAEVPAP